MENNETGRDNTDNSSNMKEKKKTGTSARWKRRLKRKLRRFVRDIFAFFAVIVITSVIGAVIFSHIYTAGGQSYYDVVAHAIKAELDNPENGGFIGTATAAVQSSVKALNKVASHADTTNSDFSSIAGGGGSKSVASSDKLEKSPNQRREYTAEEVGTESAPVVNAQTESSYGTFDDGFAMEVLNLVNDERVKEGLEPLVWNNSAASAAKIRSDEVVAQMSHTRPNESRGITALYDVGVNWNMAGENLAGGQGSPEAVMAAWMNSEVHRANILKPGYTSLGVACLYVPNSTYGYYWVQLFVG